MCVGLNNLATLNVSFYSLGSNPSWRQAMAELGGDLLALLMAGCSLLRQPRFLYAAS